MRRGILVALAVSVMVAGGVGFILRDGPDAMTAGAREDEAGKGAAGSEKAAGSEETKSRARSEREARAAEVWAALQAAPAHEAFQIIDRNWGSLEKERAKIFYSVVINKLMAAGKLGDPALLDGIKEPELRFVISSRVARTLVIDGKMDEAIAFMLAEPEVKMRGDVVGDVLTTAATPESLAGEIDALERWLEKEPAESVRLAIWDGVYSKLTDGRDDAALVRWRETGKWRGIARER
jgi:hypothetical protein